MVMKERASYHISIHHSLHLDGSSSLYYDWEGKVGRMFIGSGCGPLGKSVASAEEYILNERGEGGHFIDKFREGANVMVSRGANLINGQWPASTEEVEGIVKLMQVARPDLMFEFANRYV